MSLALANGMQKHSIEHTGLAVFLIEHLLSVMVTACLDSGCPSVWDLENEDTYG